MSAAVSRSGRRGDIPRLPAVAFFVLVVERAGAAADNCSDGCSGTSARDGADCRTACGAYSDPRYGLNNVVMSAINRVMSLLVMMLIGLDCRRGNDSRRG